MIFKEKTIQLKNGDTCILRSPNKADANDMVDFLKLTAEETHFLSRYPEEVTQTVEEEQECIADSRNSTTDLLITAFINNELAGNAHIRGIKNHIKFKHRAGFGIAIKEKYWNNGLGGLLVKEVIKQAKEMGFTQIELGVFSDNPTAQALYKKYGFEVWGTTKNAFRLKDGTYCDEIVMGQMI